MNRAEAGALVAERYRLESVVGRGGMGVVWLAGDELLHRKVAVKEIIWPPRLSEAERDELCQRALREARTAARLDHPSVIRVYDVIEDDGRPWIVMPFIRYPSLSEVLREHGPLPPRRVARIGLRILDAIQAAHAAGVLHRDVKPGNVLLGPEDQIVLTDFGMAIADGSTALTASGVLIGSPAYMAPERARGEPASRAADLWSLGATLYTAVEGRPPFDREGALAILTAVVSGPADPPTRAGPLWLVISGLLHKDPAKRLDAAEAGRMLRQVAGGAATLMTPADTTMPLTTAERPAASAMATGQPSRPAEKAAADGEARRAAGPAGAASGSALIPGLEPRPRPLPDVPDSPPPSGQDSKSGRSGRRWLYAVIAGVAAAALLAVAAVILTQPGPPRHHQASGVSAGPPSHAPSASTTSGGPSQPGTTSPAPGGSGPGPLPSGFVWYHDPTGFSIGVPQGWQVSHDGHLVYVRDPASSRFLLIDQTDRPQPNALADWRQQEASRRGTYPGYHLIRLQAVDYAQAAQAADWEFTYYHDGQLVHVLNRNILANAHHAYALYWSTPDSEWQASFQLFRAFAATFRPAGMAQGS
jgi:eukaryotic-like serine/threonine-protein kinase